MRKTRIYLHTSVICFLFADDAPEAREVTREFFEDFVKTGVYEVYISDVVIDEIARTPDRRRRNLLLGVVEDFGLRKLEIQQNADEIRSLAEAYMESGIIPRRKLEDALHIAIATVHEIDILLSWNYRHLANVNKETRVLSANLLAGYAKRLRMTSPMEVVYEED